MRSHAIKVVVLAGYHVSQLSGRRLHQPDSVSESEQSRRLLAWQAGMSELLMRLQSAGKRVVVLLDTPELLMDPRACLSRGWPFGIKCQVDMPLQDVLARTRSVDDAMDALQRRFPTVVFFDLRSGLCDELVCRASGRDVLWYATRDHLTPAGSVQAVQPLAPVLLEALRGMR